MPTGGREFELEAKVAFLERQVELLTGEVREQNRVLARMDEELARLRILLDRKQDAEDEIGPHDDPPPHYGGRI